jgi:hypothetical protein
MTSNDLLSVPTEYHQSSQRFCSMWKELVDKGQEAGDEIVNMIRILQLNGYSRTKAIEKIVLDHSHLNGFSRMTIYRKLPDNMKHEYYDDEDDYDDDSATMVHHTSAVSNDTFEKVILQPIDVNNVISTTNGYIETHPDNLSYIQILLEKNRLLTKKLEFIEKSGQPLNFVKEYQSKDNSKIQEYESLLVYKGQIFPLSVTLNLTTEKMSVFLDKVRCEKLNKTINNKNKK